MPKRIISVVLLAGTFLLLGCSGGTKVVTPSAQPKAEPTVISTTQLTEVRMVDGVYKVVPKQSKVLTADYIYNKSTVKIDKYEKTTWVKSPEVEQGSSYSVAFLRALIQNGRVTSYQVYVSDWGSDWSFYYRASDSKGRRLNYTQIDREVYDGKVIEDFTIKVSRSYLNNARKTKGIDFKAIGKRYNKVFTIPAYVVDGFLRKVDATIHKK